jgi:Tfp pilus assembly protein PilZ
MDNADAFKKRKFARHPAGIPIEISLGALAANKKEYLINISRGGLCFRSLAFVQNGTPIRIKVPLIHPVFETRARVAWCRPSGGIYEIGVVFDDQEDPLKIRMVEQICDIEQYKKNIFEKEGRKLTSEQAALEWIKKYAGTFSDDK